jgi:hypothetical protein
MKYLTASSGLKIDGTMGLYTKDIEHEFKQVE